MILTYGKYKGHRLEDVPEEYVLFMIATWERDVIRYKKELERRKDAELANLSMAEKIVQSGFRALAKEYHPDVGGISKDFRELKATYDLLKAQVKDLI